MSGNYGRLKPSTKRHNAGICMAYGCDKDNNTYCYRLTNGHKHLHRIILGRGWEHTPFDVTKLSCYEGKGEESMKGRKAKEKPSDAELMAFAEKHNHANLVKRVKIEFHVGEPTARKWLMEAGLIQPRQEKICLKPIIVDENLRHELQTPPEPGGDQPAPAQSEASAKEIITQGETDEMLVKCSECGLESKVTEKYRKHITPDGKEVCWFCFYRPGWNKSSNYATTDNDYNEREDETRGEYTAPLMGERAEREDVPQRATLTSCHYNAMLNDTDERLSALAIFCENQAVEQLRQDWAVSVFKHSRLSRERKLELIGQLLDWGAGA